MAARRAGASRAAGPTTGLGAVVPPQGLAARPGGGRRGLIAIEDGRDGRTIALKVYEQTGCFSTKPPKNDTTRIFGPLCKMERRLARRYFTFTGGSAR